MDMDKFEKAYERSRSSAGYADVDRLSIGASTVVRLVGDLESAHEHFVEIEPGKKRPFYCDGPSSGCPLCGLVNNWLLGGNTIQVKMAEEMKAGEKYYFNVIDRSPAGRAWHLANKKTKVLAQNEKGNNVGPMVLESIAKVCKMRKDTGQSHDPSTFDIQLSKTGTGFKTRYGAQFTGAVEPLSEEEKAYKLVDLKMLTTRTEAAKMAEVARALAAGSPIDVGDTSFDVHEMETNAKPADQVRAAMAPQPAIQPGATVAATATEELVLDAKGEEESFADGLADPAKTSCVAVPCSGKKDDKDCGVKLNITRGEKRRIKCHNCGKVYSAPKWKQ